VDIKVEIQKVLEIEAAAIERTKSRIDDSFVKATDILMKCKGKVVVSGIGKSGLIGQKISATMSSTGTPSVFLHPTEAAHGDMGIVMKDDVVIMISHSGETDEVVDILPSIERMNIPVIAITGNVNSTLAKTADCVLDSSIAEEACPMGLAPTASTTVQLAIGDALAVAMIKLKNFKKEDFAVFHPGGSLGKKLVMKVKDIMHSGTDVPVVRDNVLLKDALVIMTTKRFGCTAVVDAAGKLTGIFTDGDLRRMIEKLGNPFETVISGIMTKDPKTISQDELAVKALAIMETKAITVLLVIDEAGKPAGIIHLHDILKSGVV
jgi:arabinose-5-phosphate isomerase